jgi:hypothetical protein
VCAWRGEQTEDTGVDPALWFCRHINNLKLRLPPKVLTALPGHLPALERWRYDTSLSAFNLLVYQALSD